MNVENGKDRGKDDRDRDDDNDLDHHDDNGRDKVTIIVDDQKHNVKAGEWIVSDLKKEVRVDPAKALAEITPQGLVDLDDNARIKVRDKQKFMSHARSGGSS